MQVGDKEGPITEQNLSEKGKSNFRSNQSENVWNLRENNVILIEAKNSGGESSVLKRELPQDRRSRMFHLLLAVIYMAFISLGLPDALLGSAWPSMYTEFQVPVSYAGMISMIIAAGTIVSSLQSDRLTKKLGAGKVTAISVGMTALALFGFSVSHSFWVLCLWAVPYGLGAGSVDAALNNYVALHYSSRHMSWLHCMWGLGALTGPYIMGFILTAGGQWNLGYRSVSVIQVVLTVIILCSLPLWKKRTDPARQQNAENSDTENPIGLRQAVKIAGVKEILITFFCYCAIEQTAGLWGSSFLVLQHGVSAQEAARFASLFYVGITIGRAACGFITMKLNDTNMVRMGAVLILLGVVMLFIPGGSGPAKAGLVLIGLGCAPVYPSIIHSTPERFGAEKSQAIIGIQMAVAYVGTCLMPPLFGVLAEKVSIGLFPVYLCLILVLMFLMHERTVRQTSGQNWTSAEKAFTN